MEVFGSAGVHGQRDPLGPGGWQAFKIVDSGVEVLTRIEINYFPERRPAGLAGRRVLTVAPFLCYFLWVSKESKSKHECLCHGTPSLKHYCRVLQTWRNPGLRNDVLVTRCIPMTNTVKAVIQLFRTLCAGVHGQRDPLGPEG